MSTIFHERMLLITAEISRTRGHYTFIITGHKDVCSSLAVQVNPVRFAVLDVEPLSRPQLWEWHEEMAVARVDGGRQLVGRRRRRRHCKECGR